jgi:hypothetical protein
MHMIRLLQLTRHRGGCLRMGWLGVLRKLRRPLTGIMCSADTCVHLAVCTS